MMVLCEIFWNNGRNSQLRVISERTLRTYRKKNTVAHIKEMDPITTKLSELGDLTIADFYKLMQDTG